MTSLIVQLLKSHDILSATLILPVNCQPFARRLRDFSIFRTLGLRFVAKVSLVKPTEDILLREEVRGEATGDGDAEDAALMTGALLHKEARGEATGEGDAEDAALTSYGAGG